MKDKDLIKSYFENYYPDNKKYVYNEDAGITALIFIFLLFLMIKAFSNKNVPVITRQIENNPKIPDQIIKNLENIKKIIIEHNPGKDLKFILTLLDEIDDNLILLKNKSNIEKTVEIINNQLIKFLQYVTELYEIQNSDKKNILFYELNKVLQFFGLSDIFEKLLKVANDKKEIKTDDNKTIVLSQKDIDGLLTDEEREDIKKIKSDEEEEEEEEEDLLDSEYEEDDDFEDSYDPEEEENKKILHEKDQSNIKLYIISKKHFVDTSSHKEEIVSVFNYIIDNINQFNLSDLKKLYLLLYKSENIRDFEENFHRTDIFDIAKDKLDELNSKYKNMSDYERLLNLLKNKKYFIEEYPNKKFFLIKIDSDDYKFGKIIPLSSSDKSDFYCLIFYEENQKFEINIKKEDEEKYKIYDPELKLLIENRIDILSLSKVCEGNWNFTEGFKSIKFDISEYTRGYSLTKYNDITRNNQTFIAKGLENLAQEQRIDTITIRDSKYYYCIKPEEEGILFMIEIKGDFISFLKKIYTQGHLQYLSYGGTLKNYILNKELKELILFDCRYGKPKQKNHFFKQLQNLQRSSLKNDNTPADYFYKILPEKYRKNDQGFIKISTTGNWYIK